VDDSAQRSLNRPHRVAQCTAQLPVELTPPVRVRVS
jgi:hypothetical protein